MMSVGERLCIAMKSKGVSQRQLSEDCGISSSALSRYINGKSIPRVDTVEMIADYLGVPSKEILCDDEETKGGE